MAKSAGAAGSNGPMRRLEQIAQLVRTSRNPFTTLDRVLHTLTDALGARGGAIILADASPKRQQEWGLRGRSATDHSNGPGTR